MIIRAAASNEQYGRMGFTDSGANGKIYLGIDDVSGTQILQIIVYGIIWFMSLMLKIMSLRFM